MTTTQTLNQLDALIRSRSILQHPFYLAWQAGELTREQLTTYAGTYYPHVSAFPRHLQAAAKGASDPTVRSEIEENLSDELSSPEAHDKLWLDFAQGLGGDRAAVAEADAQPAARTLIDTFARFSEDHKSSTAQALAAFYAYESQQPEVSRTKSDGLREYYGIDDDSTVAYFEVHAEADIEHRAGERAALAQCLEAGATSDEVLDAAQQTLDAYWGLLDGICEQAGVPQTC